MLIAVDFDGTLIHGETPIEGAKQAMQELRDKGHKILIYSCNNPPWIAKVLDKHEIPYDWIYEGKYGKPVCDCYVDDRAIGFREDWSKTLDDIYAYAEKWKK